MRYHVTKSELEILNVLWKVGKAMSHADILEQSQDKTWKDNSIHILLNGLLKKGFIREAGFARSGKVWGRLYAPAFTAEEYYTDMLRTGPKLDPVQFFKLFFEQDRLDAETVSALQEVVENALSKEKR